MTSTNNTTVNNHIVYHTCLNKIIFFWPFGLGLAAAVLWYQVPVARQASMIFAFVATVWILMTWITYLFSSVTIKQRQVILRTGMLVRQTIDIPLNKIESIDIRQSILGSLFRYGSLIITGTGGTRHLINYINKPLTCRRHIEQLMHH